VGYLSSTSLRNVKQTLEDLINEKGKQKYLMVKTHYRGTCNGVNVVRPSDKCHRSEHISHVTK